MEKGKKVHWSAGERDMLISKCDDAFVVTGKFSSSLTAADKVRFWVDVTVKSVIFTTLTFIFDPSQGKQTLFSKGENQVIVHSINKDEIHKRLGQQHSIVCKSQ
jgi:hypothetical protein